MGSLTKKSRTILMPMVLKHLPNAKIYPGSDIDLGFDEGARIDWRIMSKILDDIDESNVSVTVDLIDMHNTSPELLEQMDWAREYGMPYRDDRGIPHWDGGREHVHVPGAPKNHMPVRND